MKLEKDTSQDIGDLLRVGAEPLREMVSKADETPPVKPNIAAVRKGIRDNLIRRMNKDGPGAPLKNSAVNVERVLRNDPDYAQRLWLNEWSKTVQWGDKDYSDTRSTEIRIAMFETYGFEPTKALVDEVVVKVAKEYAKNPLKDWLEALRWDGEERIDGYLTKAIGADDSGLHRQISRRWLIQCIARALKPGCKADAALILTGGQGTKKSTSFEILAGEEYFVDSALEIGDRRGYLQLAMAWIYELAELDSIRRRESTQVKAFLTAHHDTFTVPYGRFPQKVPRHCVFCGTTNKATFLSDPTGSRRFWPVRVGEIDLDWIQENREHLWAEAVVAYKKGERWWLTHEEEVELREASAVFQELDPWVEVIEPFVNLKRVSGVTIHQVMKDCLRLENSQMNRSVEMRISDILSSMGYRKARAMKEGIRQYVWRQPSAEVIDISTATTKTAG